MIITSFISAGNILIIGFLISVLFTFFHIFIILLSIIIEFLFTREMTGGNDLELGRAIESFVKERHLFVTTEQDIIDWLRRIKFSLNPDQISRPIIQELVKKMSRERGKGMPSLTIIQHDKYIPRWSTDLYLKLEDALPSLLIFSCPDCDKSNVSDSMNPRFKERVLDRLSENAKISVELLKDDNSIKHKYYGVHLYEKSRSYFGYGERRFVILRDKHGERFIPENQEIYTYSDFLIYFKKITEFTLCEGTNDIEELLLTNFPFERIFGGASQKERLIELIKHCTLKDASSYFVKLFFEVTGVYPGDFTPFEDELYKIFSKRIREVLEELVKSEIVIKKYYAENSSNLYSVQNII